MREVKTLIRIKMGGKYFPPGSRLPLSEEDIASLLGQVEIIPTVAETALPIPIEVSTDNDTGDAPEDRISVIVEALDLLDDKDFKADGTPKIRALSDVIGFEPSAEEIAAALAVRAAGETAA